MHSRKIGIDMSNAMLWAAFAAVILMTTFYTYATVKISHEKRMATTLISAITSDIRGIKEIHGNYDFLSSDFLVDVGSVPDNNIRQVNGETKISFDPSSTLVFSPSPNRSRFDLDITWDTNGRIPQAVCRYLASAVSENVPSGALGENYEILSASCSLSSPTLSVTYFR